MTQQVNVLNLPDGTVWDVFDAETAGRLLHNATVYDVDMLLSKRATPIIVEPVGMRHSAPRMEGRVDPKPRTTE